jgi:L-lysine 2,3-aminomutase
MILARAIPRLLGQHVPEVAYNDPMLNTSPLNIPLSPQLTWQEQLANLISDPQELLALLQLNPTSVGYSEAALHSFPLRVTRAYAAKMRVGDPHDPLLRQVLPQHAEMLAAPDLSTDPLQESAYNPAPGILHKYQGRVLLITTQSCAIHCRYCFRRHFPYQDNRLSRAQWRQSLQYVAADSSIKEVIFSGGDPLALANGHLETLLGLVNEIPHVERIRFHTRLPIVLPARVDDSLLAMLRRAPQQCVMVVHANHAQEVDAEVRSACERLRAAGATLLNQSVLLAGINDHVDTLTQLSEQLFAANVLPYYLHLPDNVSGTGHFLVSKPQAITLLQQMQTRLPGYLVPKLVQEEPGAPSKTRL